MSAAVALVAVGPATGSPVAAADGPAEIVGVQSERCFGVIGTDNEPRTGVDIYDCEGQANQLWTYTEDRELKVNDDNTCLDVRGENTEKGAVAQTYPCHGRDNQKWDLNADGSITGVQSGLCLDVLRRRTANSSVVKLWTCNGQTNQQWTTTLDAPDPVDDDTRAPSAPGAPVVTDVRCDAATVSWPAADYDTAVTGYDVYRDGQFLTAVDGSTLSTGIDVDPGARWGIYVNARDAAGNISQASVTTPLEAPECGDDTEAPTIPTALAAEASGTSVTLMWDAATDDVGVRSYIVRRDGADIAEVTGTAQVAPATRFTEVGLDADTTYSYTIRAADAQGNVSDQSDAVEVPTDAACDTAICDVREVATDTDIPWGLVTLPDGTVLYNRRDAYDIIHLDPATGTKTTIGEVPNVDGTDGEGGLTGLAISDDFATDGWLYIMHTSEIDNRIVRIQFDGETLLTDTSEVLLTGIERNKFHDGGRLRFGPDGKLYAAAGDAQDDDSAQDLTSLNGKILRIDPDGGIPSDNPFGNAVWSYGHRNPQGLAFDSQGRLWQQEFGNSRMDETNLVVKGGNYGWPACEGTLGDCDDPDFIAPAATYDNSEASCSGIAIVDDALYIACLGGTKMIRHTIDGDTLTGQQVFFDGTYGRLRTVEPAPGGGLWLTTSNLGNKDSIANNSDERIFYVTLGPKVT